MEQQDYNKTLNLPVTEFPMRAGLPTREPEALKTWQDEDVYGELMKKNEGKPLYILHDGPPYANGNIHIRIVAKSKNPAIIRAIEIDS